MAHLYEPGLRTAGLGCEYKQTEPSTCAALGNNLNWNVLMNLLLQFSPLPLIIRHSRETSLDNHCSLFVFLQWDAKQPERCAIYFLLKTAMTALRHVQILKTINRITIRAHLSVHLQKHLHLGQGPTPPATLTTMAVEGWHTHTHSFCKIYF